MGVVALSRILSLPLSLSVCLSTSARTLTWSDIFSYRSVRVSSLAHTRLSVDIDDSDGDHSLEGRLW